MPPHHDGGAPSGPQRTWWGRNWIWVVPTSCVGCLLLPVGCVTALGFLLFGFLRSSEPYALALERARQEPRVIEALGEPIEVGWMMQGSINFDGDSGHADFSIPLTGPRGSARVHVVAERAAGEWVYERLEVEIDATGERIDLRPGPEETDRDGGPVAPSAAHAGPRGSPAAAAAVPIHATVAAYHGGDRKVRFVR